MCSMNTPVSILNTLVQKANIVPQYSQLPTVSKGRKQVFRYSVKVQEVVGFGEGSTKKMAKHQAARDALSTYSTLIGIPVGDLIPERRTSSTFSSMVNVNEGLEPAADIQINAVGLLQEFAAVRKLSKPEYRVIAEVGPSHRRVFTMECKVDAVRRSASEYSKKKAKHLCAYEVYQCLLNPKPELEFPEDYTKSYGYF